MPEDNAARMLRQHWAGLRNEARRQWYDIVRLFDSAVRSLPDDPIRGDFGRMIEEIRPALYRYQSGRRLLDVIVAIVDGEIGEDEPMWQKKNRFRELPDTETESAGAGAEAEA